MTKLFHAFNTILTVSLKNAKDNHFFLKKFGPFRKRLYLCIVIEKQKSNQQNRQTMKTTRMQFSGRVSAIGEQVMEVLREALMRLGGEYQLTANDYGFATAWLENGDEVWWDKYENAMHMDELTELCALLETICATEEEIIEQQ